MTSVLGICGCDCSLVMVQTGICSFSSATFVMCYFIYHSTFERSPVSSS